MPFSLCLSLLSLTHQLIGHFSSGLGLAFFDYRDTLKTFESHAAVAELQDNGFLSHCLRNWMLIANESLVAYNFLYIKLGGDALIGGKGVIAGIAADIPDILSALLENLTDTALILRLGVYSGAVAHDPPGAHKAFGQNCLLLHACLNSLGLSLLLGLLSGGAGIQSRSCWYGLRRGIAVGT